jgi:hypothetical protein
MDSDKDGIHHGRQGNDWYKSEHGTGFGGMRILAGFVRLRGFPHGNEKPDGFRDTQRHRMRPVVPVNWNRHIVAG